MRCASEASDEAVKVAVNHDDGEDILAQPEAADNTQLPDSSGLIMLDESNNLPQNAD